MRPAEEFWAASESVFDKTNPLLNFCANPAESVLKLQNAPIKRCFDHRKLAFGVQENNYAKGGEKKFFK